MRDVVPQFQRRRDPLTLRKLLASVGGQRVRHVREGFSGNLFYRH